MTSQPDETIRKLNALTQVLGVDAGVLASALGVQKGTLQAWLDGSRKPGKAAQLRVNEVFGQMTRGDGGHDRLRTILALLEASYGTLRLEAPHPVTIERPCSCGLSALLRREDERG
jgi:hypothetical protein